MGNRDDRLSPLALSISAASRVADLKSSAAELSALCEDMMPDPDLLDDLSPDLLVSRTQLLCLYLRERGMRRRLMQMLAAEV